MNKTLKRQVFRHTALYAAILMFSHTGGGGGGGGGGILNSAIFIDHTNQPEVKSGGSNFNLRGKKRKPQI
ncbi:hypothetical protein, partial [Neisseria meningitidis]|uniref:hypothetical protein n=1 Tax=Neisseria meningitidis TaxID=487 RepID=UPI000FEF897A